MRLRGLIMLTGLVAAILGAVVVYLMMSVPNDLQAGSLLKQARSDIAAGKTAAAHIVLSRVIQQYPRTDAAAAATVALVKLEEKERERMAAQISELRKGHEQHAQTIADLRRSMAALRKAAQPPAVAATAAPAKVPTITVIKAPTKKPTARKSTPTRRKKR